MTALSGQDFPAVQIGAHFEAFGQAPGSGWQFYTSGEEEPPFALSVKGSAAQCCGPCDPEELSSFLRFLGVEQLVWRQPAPEGFVPGEPVCQFEKAPGEPPAALTVPEGFRLLTEPSMDGVTRLVMEVEELAASGQEFYDEFYSRGCTLRNRGLARIWALQGPDGSLAATAGVYGIWDGRAWLSGVHTREALRGRGLGGWLVSALTAALNEQELTVGLWCRPVLAPFYSHLGFCAHGSVPQYLAQKE